jgi:hypothetical protein
MKLWQRLLVTAMLAQVTSVASAQQMNIIVEDTTRETVGSRLSFAVKERIRSSTGFKLVTARDEALFRMSIVTIDDKSGYSTVYSVVFSAWQPQTGTWTYLNNLVGTCGTNRIAECADGLVADADKTSEEPRQFYKTYFRDKDKK